MDEQGCDIWLEKVWRNRPGGVRNKKSLLVWDQFSAHLTPKVDCRVRSLNNDDAVIPGGLTAILQPLDVSMNKPFKTGLRHRWQSWMASDDPKPCTKGGNIKAPSLDTLAQWVLDSWNEIKSPIIVKSFKKSCIPNAADDVLYL